MTDNGTLTQFWRDVNNVGAAGVPFVVPTSKTAMREFPVPINGFTFEHRLQNIEGHTWNCVAKVETPVGTIRICAFVAAEFAGWIHSEIYLPAGVSRLDAEKCLEVLGKFFRVQIHKRQTDELLKVLQ